MARVASGKARQHSLRYHISVEDSNVRRYRTAGADPGDRLPAPGPLRLVQALVNTLSRHTREDLLATPDAAAQWLAAAGVIPAGSPVTGSEHRVLLELREAIRAVLGTHTHRRSSPAAAAGLTTALRTCRLAVVAGPAGSGHLVSADHDPFTRALGAVAVAIAEAAITGSWARLKSCPGYKCGWAFYDRSASGGSRWCDMQLCGSRAKMKAYRQRQAADPPASGAGEG
jgi:predicted RNA-binding Zn ribbon-like protein